MANLVNTKPLVSEEIIREYQHEGNLYVVTASHNLILVGKMTRPVQVVAEPAEAVPGKKRGPKPKSEPSKAATPNGLSPTPLEQAAA